MCWNSALTMRRVSCKLTHTWVRQILKTTFPTNECNQQTWKIRSSDHRLFVRCKKVAIRLCSRSQMVCIAVSPGLLVAPMVAWIGIKYQNIVCSSKEEIFDIFVSKLPALKHLCCLCDARQSASWLPCGRPWRKLPAVSVKLSFPRSLIILITWVFCTNLLGTVSKHLLRILCFCKCDWRPNNLSVDSFVDDSQAWVVRQASASLVYNAVDRLEVWYEIGNVFEKWSNLAGKCGSSDGISIGKQASLTVSFESHAWQSRELPLPSEKCHKLHVPLRYIEIEKLIHLSKYCSKALIIHLK